MGVSANHHYVPQALLRNFCFQGESIYYFSKSKRDPRIERRNISKIFMRRHLNSTIGKNKEKNDDLEKFFAKNFDEKIVAFTRKFEIAGGNRSSVNVTEVEHRFFVQCLYNLMKRTPEFHEPLRIQDELERLIPAAIGAYQREVRPLSIDEISAICSEEVKNRIIHNARVEVLGRQAPIILDLLARRRLCFALPRNERKSFIISSQPVIRMTNNGDTNLRTGDVELWVPLTPKLAAGLLTPKSNRNVFTLPDNAVRHFNMAMFQNSLSIASHSEQLLKSIINPR